MKPLVLAALCAFCAQGALADEVTLSVANGTSARFETLTVYAMQSGKVLDTVVGAVDKPLRQGRTAQIKLDLPACQPVFVQALWGSDGVASLEADACDPAIFTLTE